MAASSYTCDEALSVVLGGGSVATNGFRGDYKGSNNPKSPDAFYIEDNRYGISSPWRYQPPGGSIARNRQRFQKLEIFSGDGVEPVDAG